MKQDRLSVYGEIENGEPVLFRDVTNMGSNEPQQLGQPLGPAGSPVQYFPKLLPERGFSGQYFEIPLETRHVGSSIRGFELFGQLVELLASAR